MSPFEALMLLCFGAAWPFSIYTSYVSRSTKGKSLFFLIVLFIGYTSGIMHKLLYARDPVIVLYLLNWTMVGIDIVLYMRNRKIEKEAFVEEKASR